MSHHFHYPSGLTIIEASVVVAIIGVLTVLVIPPVRTAQESLKLIAAAHELRAELHRTRILSIVRNQDCRFRVTSTTTYLVECQTPAWDPIQSYQVRTGHTLRANNRPEFHPRGNVAPMATIVLSNRAGDEKRLIVNRSGRVRIE